MSPQLLLGSAVGFSIYVAVHLMIKAEFDNAKDYRRFTRLLGAPMSLVPTHGQKTGDFPSKKKMAIQTITSWNQIVQWLREMNLLREAAVPCAA